VSKWRDTPSVSLLPKVCPVENQKNMFGCKIVGFSLSDKKEDGTFFYVVRLTEIRRLETGNFFTVAIWEIFYPLQSACGIIHLN